MNTETPTQNPTQNQPAPAVRQGLPPRRLARAMDDQMIGGVCGGLARYANVDVTLVRVLSVVLGVFTFPVAIVAYLALWLVMPAG